MNYATTDQEFAKAALRSATEQAVELNQAGYTLAISAPKWNSHVDWIDHIMGLSTYPRTIPKKARSTTLRLKLADDYQLQMHIKTEVHQFGDNEEPFEQIDSIKLEVCRPYERTFYGQLVTTCDEMSVTIVAIQGPQSVADNLLRVLSTPDADRLAETLCPLLASIGRCHFCGRPLRDKVSRVLQIGPSCAKAFGIAHNQHAASLVSQQIASLLR